jgi:hypothetical protein
MARLLLISINASPELTGFAPHATALAKHFARLGRDTSVLTGFLSAPHRRRWVDRRGVVG